MPSVSEAQRRLFSIAEHEPGKLHKENRGLLKLGHEKLHEFSATKGLKVHKSAMDILGSGKRKAK